jgi:tetratricopeptide (TPR) repeat protein
MSEARSLFNEAYSLGEKGRNEEAIQLYRKSIQLDPHYKRAHLNLGVNLEGIGLYEQAVQR